MNGDTAADRAATAAGVLRPQGFSIEARIVYQVLALVRFDGARVRTAEFRRRTAAASRAADATLTRTEWARGYRELARAGRLPGGPKDA